MPPKPPEWAHCTGESQMGSPRSGAERLLRRQVGVALARDRHDHQQTAHDREILGEVAERIQVAERPQRIREPAGDGE